MTPSVNILSFVQSSPKSLSDSGVKGPSPNAVVLLTLIFSPAHISNFPKTYRSHVREFLSCINNIVSSAS